MNAPTEIPTRTDPGRLRPGFENPGPEIHLGHGHRITNAILGFLILLTIPLVPAEERGAEVVVLYNAALPDSQAVAEHYAQRRGVPTNQVIGLPMPTTEAISRADFETRIEAPLVAALRARELIKVRDEIRAATDSAPGRIVQVLQESRVRYLAPCYGVPLRVAEDPTYRDPIVPAMHENLRRNEAAVDAELTALPLLLTGVARTGPIVNVWAGTTNAAHLHPLNGVFVVSRLDGPTPQIARALVDRALEAEQNGLLGRGYFDLRGTTDPAYQPGDLWISNAWAAVSRYGYDTHLDQRPATLPVGFPLSHVAFYAGWYDQNASGPFALPQVEFMPGAVAYHLHSFSASTLRSTNHSWAAPFLARGVTATMGSVAEPYLDGTPEVGICFTRLIYGGFTWGEAVLASQRLLSWMTVAVGDPLYRPFAVSALERAKDLAARRQGRLDWTLVTLYNRKKESSRDLPAVIAELEQEPRLRFSALLEEKLADFLVEADQPERAAGWYRKAAGWMVSPQQRKRLLWNAAEAAQKAGRTSDAYDSYRQLLRESEHPPEPRLLHERLQSLALALGKDAEARQWAQELERHSPSPSGP